MRLGKILLFVILIGVVAVPFSGCSAGQSMDMSMLPDHVQEAPESVQEAYVYAMNHPDEVANYPCYCGCGNMGHTSNLSCYIAEIKDDGTIVWDNHAAGCGICVDITQDVMRMKSQGKSSAEIRTYIDATYSPFGPGTDTPFPES